MNYITDKKYLALSSNHFNGLKAINGNIGRITNKNNTQINSIINSLSNLKDKLIKFNVNFDMNSKQKEFILRDSSILLDNFKIFITNNNYNKNNKLKRPNYLNCYGTFTDNEDKSKSIFSYLDNIDSDILLLEKELNINKKYYKNWGTITFCPLNLTGIYSRTFSWIPYFLSFFKYIIIGGLNCCFPMHLCFNVNKPITYFDRYNCYNDIIQYDITSMKRSIQTFKSKYEVIFKNINDINNNLNNFYSGKKINKEYFITKNKLIIDDIDNCLKIINDKY